MTRKRVYTALASLGIAAALAAGALALGPRWRVELEGSSEEVRALIEEIESGRRPSGWIVEASVELRAAPSANASVVARLARSTPLVVREESAGWARVRVYQRALTGWVPSRAIGTAADAIPETPRPAPSE
jgi:SH3-like domain-containing protein